MVWYSMPDDMWEDCPNEDLDAKKLEGFPGKSDYPEKDGWRDEEEYHRQLQSWTDVQGEEKRPLEYSSILRRRRKEVRRRTVGKSSLVSGPGNICRADTRATCILMAYNPG